MATKTRRKPVKRTPTRARPLIQVTTTPRRKTRTHRRRSSLAAVTRRVGWWAAKGAGRAAASAATHGASTAGRVSTRAYEATALRREEKRLHGRRPVVRDLTEPHGPPLSTSQVESHLLGLETARAREEGRPDPAWAHRARPVPDELVERVAGPQTLGWRERRDLRRHGWSTDAWHGTHARVTEQLEDVRRFDAEVENLIRREPVTATTRPVPTPGTSTAGTPGGTTVIEPKTFDDLADPGIDQQNWQEELPEHTRQVAQLLERAAEAMSTYWQYHQQAQTREDVLNPIQAAQEAVAQAREEMGDAANAAEQWAAEVQLPRYDRAS